jgi:hypothetical protein
LAQYYKSFNNNSFHTIRAPARFEPESTRDPTASVFCLLESKILSIGQTLLYSLA